MEIRLWEDDFCRIQFLPPSNRGFCIEEIKKSKAFGEAHRARDGFGWTKVYIVEESPKPLKSMAINIDALRELATPIFSEIKSIYYQGDDQLRETPNSSAFANSPDSVVFAEWDDNGIVEHLWMALIMRNDAQKTDFLKFFDAMRQRYDLLFVDWGWGFVADLQERERLDHYLSKLVERFGKRKPRGS